MTYRDKLKRPTKNPRVVQLCPAPERFPVDYGSFGDPEIALCLALGDDGRIYGVDRAGGLFVLEDK